MTLVESVDSALAMNMTYVIIQKWYVYECDLSYICNNDLFEYVSNHFQ